MIDKLKKLHQLYKQERYKENTQFIENPKTGLSPHERNRINAFPPLTEGIATWFGQPFHFSDAPGFLHSVDEIYGQDIYKFTNYNKYPFILDCGANIGLSIAYFKMHYPESEIIAFEPDEHTFKILEKNIEKYGSSVTLKKEAVWIEDTELSFYPEGSLAGSLVVDIANRNKSFKVKATNIKKYLDKRVDFLKIDIEGAENTLIFDIEDHLDYVQNLFLEYHGIINTDQNLGEILNLLKKKGFQYYIRVAGETMNLPFCGETPNIFNQQLNIFCYRK